MTTDIILEGLRRELADDLLAKSDAQYKFQPTDFDIHIASAGLQKGIRRGETETALRCAARLLESDPARLWRRLAVVAVEDVGIANPDLMGKVIAIAGQKRWRQAHGGQWRVTAHVVDALSRSMKDRSADDLIVLVEHDPDLADHRRCWATASVDQLAEIAIDEIHSISAKAIAAWYGCGTARYRSGVLRERNGDANLIFDAYRNGGIGERIVESCRFAARQSQYPMAIFVPILAKMARKAALHEKIDPIPPREMIGDLPAYVFDAYTRTGKAAVARLLIESESLKQFLKTHAVEKQWRRIVGQLLFRVEGGLLVPRLRWHLGDEIRDNADILIPGLPSEVVPVGLDLVRNQLPHLNTIRAQIVVEEAG